MDDIVRAQIYNMMEMSIALTKQLQNENLSEALANEFISNPNFRGEHKLVTSFYNDMKKENPKLMVDISLYEFVCYIQIMHVMGMIVSNGVLNYEKTLKQIFDENVFHFKQ